MAVAAEPSSYSAPTDQHAGEHHGRIPNTVLETTDEACTAQAPPAHVRNGHSPIDTLDSADAASGERAVLVPEHAAPGGLSKMPQNDGLGISIQRTESKQARRVLFEEARPQAKKWASITSNARTRPPDGMNTWPGSLDDAEVASSPGLQHSPPHSTSNDYELGDAKSFAEADYTPSLGSTTCSFTVPIEGADQYPLTRRTSSASAYAGNFHPPTSCPPSKPFHQRGCSWFGTSILLFALFSTVFSGLFVAFAIMGKRWGSSIRTSGSFTPSGATILTTVFAKVIEMSFVAVVVTFLGQALSRRAFDSSNKRGVTLAEMSLRNWVLQPGTMVTHPSSLRHGALSVLGITSLIATVLATLYTTAAQALVQPQLRYNKWEAKTMQGLVKTSFANSTYVKSQCQTPITQAMDNEYGGNTCYQIQNSALSYTNYQRYMANWAEFAQNGTGSTDMAQRPPGYALMYENTTITAPWVDSLPPRQDEAGLIITNISLAFPHAGVYQAARDPANGILQPQDLDGLGLYHVRASVGSPVLNALCVQTSNQTDLAPLVYTAWQANDSAFNASLWPSQLRDVNMTNFRNTTKFDDIFGWDSSYGTGKGRRRAYPIFPKYPVPYNTVLNNTQAGYGRDSIYLLGQGGGPSRSGTSLEGKYIICELSASLTSDCSTHYNATTTGGTMAAVCGNSSESQSLEKVDASAPSGMAARSKDWFDIGLDWSNSLSLGTGISDGKASNSRLLMQLLLSSPELEPSLPSVSEALAVMAGSTLLASALDAPFDNRPRSSLQPDTATFQASVRGQEYSSGGTGSGQKGFLVVLGGVFLGNAAMLAYLLWQRGLVTDYTEPPVLFCLAMNSPPSGMLAGSCGAGPSGDMYEAGWVVGQEGEHLYLRHKGEAEARQMRAPAFGADDGLRSPAQAEYWELSKRRSLL